MVEAVTLVTHQVSPPRLTVTSISLFFSTKTATSLVVQLQVPLEFLTLVTIGLQEGTEVETTEVVVVEVVVVVVEVVEVFVEVVLSIEDVVVEPLEVVVEPLEVVVEPVDVVPVEVVVEPLEVVVEPVDVVPVVDVVDEVVEVELICRPSAISFISA
jgi:hypothetical protein